MLKYHSSSSGLKKKVKKKKKSLIFLIGKNRHVIGEKVAIFDWEWGLNAAPREGQKIPCKLKHFAHFTHLRFIDGFPYDVTHLSFMRNLQKDV